MSDIHLDVPYPLDECFRRLQSAAGASPAVVSEPRDYEVIVRRRGPRGVVLRLGYVRVETPIGPVFRFGEVTRFVGRLEAHESGTSIVGHFGLPRLAVAWAVMVLLPLLSVLVLSAIKAAAVAGSPTAPEPKALLQVISPVVPICAIALALWLLRGQARRDNERLARFLRETLAPARPRGAPATGAASLT